MKKPTPFISVIIIAHNKRDFLSTALSSVLNQTMNRKEYEILLVKGFDDLRLEGFCKKRGIRTITTHGPKTIGENFYIGITKSKGEILCLLEDDDVFHSQKLQTVCDSFRANPDLIYYHNAYDVINQDGIAIPGLGPAAQIFVENQSELEMYLPELISTDAAGLTSSISLRKSLFGKSLEALLNQNIKISIDFLLFFLSANTHKSMISDSKVLSSYRKHGSTPSGGPSDTTSHNIHTFEEFRTKLAEGHIRSLNDLTEIDSLIQDKACKECIKYLIIDKKLNLAFSDPSLAQTTKLSEYIFYLRYLARLKHKKNNILQLVVFLMAALAPEITLRRYYKYYLNKYNLVST